VDETAEGDTLVGGPDLPGTGDDDPLFDDARTVRDAVVRGGNDSLSGGAGADTHYGDNESAEMTGTFRLNVTRGADTLAGGSRRNILIGDNRTARTVTTVRGFPWTTAPARSSCTQVPPAATSSSATTC
jgi:Ca2+-binding RTX toxin-like protein